MDPKQASSLMDEIRAAVTEIQSDPELNEVRFRHTSTFTLGPHAWTCRFSVRDVQKLKPDEAAKLRVYADANNLVYTDLRRLTVHPDDTPPFPGATIPFDDGVLEVLEWSQVSDFTGQRVGTCVLRRP